MIFCRHYQLTWLDHHYHYHWNYKGMMTCTGLHTYAHTHNCAIRSWMCCSMTIFQHIWWFFSFTYDDENTAHMQGKNAVHRNNNVYLEKTSCMSWWMILCLVQIWREFEANLALKFIRFIPNYLPNLNHYSYAYNYWCLCWY